MCPQPKNREVELHHSVETAAYCSLVIAFTTSCRLSTKQRALSRIQAEVQKREAQISGRHGTTPCSQKFPLPNSCSLWGARNAHHLVTGCKQTERRHETSFEKTKIRKETTHCSLALAPARSCSLSYDVARTISVAAAAAAAICWCLLSDDVIGASDDVIGAGMAGGRGNWGYVWWRAKPALFWGGVKPGAKPGEMKFGGENGIFARKWLGAE